MCHPSEISLAFSHYASPGGRSAFLYSLGPQAAPEQYCWLGTPQHCALPSLQRDVDGGLIPVQFGSSVFMVYTWPQGYLASWALPLSSRRHCPRESRRDRGSAGFSCRGGTCITGMNMQVVWHIQAEVQSTRRGHQEMRAPGFLQGLIS